MNTKGLLLILGGAVLTVILYFVFFSTGAEFLPRPRKAIPNVQEAKAYDDLVAEIFQASLLKTKLHYYTGGSQKEMILQNRLRK